ncbi:MAG: AMP-binding protein, partial [Candidatus Binatia bacterium]
MASKSSVPFTAQDVPQSIPDRFEKIVRRFPQRIAVKTANQTVTYADLNATANRLAHLICAQRGGLPEPVALLLEKDVPLMAAMLAVLKTGKFFVLLDPSLPKARITDTLEDSQA